MNGRGFPLVRLYNNRKRVLLTGPAGFTGSHPTYHLMAQGHKILCLGNLFTGAKRNIDHLHENLRFEFTRHNVTFPLYVEVDEICKAQDQLGWEPQVAIEEWLSKIAAYFSQILPELEVS